ncbi:translation initiation factor IF-3 [Miniphocaeibacter massiliensis]|uniref:translation initiation factor IF-3 n=1 Tax=Miniphocaeibacter massiliensis TaxID=2041841 RepID=UPI000C08D262|nr:translation initiation factor IF-3 [Miniphocaeibacter massiliensis]
MKELQINEEIRAKEVRLIDAQGEQRGVVSIREARDLANESKLDLVNIAPIANPPVCKIIDYGKYRYETIKKEKESKKKQKTITVKEIRLRPNIDKHDLEVKAKRANEFLSKGDKVKVTVRFRGRELGHTGMGKDLLEVFAGLISENGVVEKRPAMEGRSMIMILNSNINK